MIIHDLFNRKCQGCPREDRVDLAVVGRTRHDIVRVDIEVGSWAMFERVTVPQAPWQVPVTRHCLPITPQHWNEETLVLSVEYERTEQLNADSWVVYLQQNYIIIEPVNQISHWEISMWDMASVRHQLRLQVHEHGARKSREVRIQLGACSSRSAWCRPVAKGGFGG